MINGNLKMREEKENFNNFRLWKAVGLNIFQQSFDELFR